MPTTQQINQQSATLSRLRTDLDQLTQLTDSLTPYEGYIFHEKKSTQIRSAANSLRLSKAWLGQLLGFLGEPTPYKNDGNRNTIEDIEPAADHKKIDPDLNKPSHIRGVDFLRQEIAKMSLTMLQIVTLTREESICRTNAWTHLIEAKTHLGFELGRIRDASTTR